MGKVYTLLWTKTAQKPYRLGRRKTVVLFVKTLRIVWRGRYTDWNYQVLIRIINLEASQGFLNPGWNILQACRTFGWKLWFCSPKGLIRKLSRHVEKPPRISNVLGKNDAQPANLDYKFSFLEISGDELKDKVSKSSERIKIPVNPLTLI